MKWSGRVKLSADALVIRLLAVLAVVGTMRVCVWPRLGRRVVSVIVVGLLIIGSFVLAPVPVVQGATIVSSVLPITKINSVTVGSVYHFYWTDGQAWNIVPRVSTCSMTVDGVAATWVGVVMKASGTDKVIGLSGEGPWTAFTNGAYHVVSWTAGTLVPNDFDGVNLYTWPAGSQSMKLPVTTNGVFVNTVLAPSVSISGPSAVSSVDGGTWIATGAGGTAPYTYAWTYGAIGPFFSWPHSGATFIRVLPVGTWTIECRVTDSTGVTAIADQVVTSSLIVGAYTVHLVRSGVYGQSISANVHNADGTYIGIAGASGTQLGIYADLAPPAELSYGYFDNEGLYGGSVDGAADGSTGLWRWTMALTVGEATAPPPADFWFKTSLTLTDDTVLLVMHHFGGISDIVDSWYEPGGNDVDPEVPPVPGSNLPAWVQALLDALYLLFSPIILVAEIFKMLFNWIVGLLGYIGGAISIVASFGLLMVRWLTVVVASVFNFATAAPGSYVSIQGIMTLAGAGAIAGDTSVFKTVGFSVASMNTVLGSLHTWVMAASHQWIWWAAFSYAFLAFVLQLGGGSSGGEE